MRAFWIVWCPTGRTPPSVKHEDYQAAYDEAERLAIANPGKDFFVLASARRYRATSPVEIEDFDPIPF